MKGCGKKIGPFQCCQVVRGDSLSLVRQIPKGVIGLCATDPPYGIGYQSNMRTKSEKFAKLKNDDNDTRLRVYRRLPFVMKMDSALVTFCSYKNVAIDMVELQEIFNIRNLLVWYKGGGGIGDLKHSLATDYELAIVAHKGACPIRGKRDGSVLTVGKVNANTQEHATQKPVALFEKIITKFSDPGALVLDPYCGSGACLIAAKRTGRHFLGFDLDKKNCEIATKALESVDVHPQVRTSNQGESKYDYFDMVGE